MKKRNNFSQLVRQEMVNRFESVVKEELLRFESCKVEIKKNIDLLYDLIEKTNELVNKCHNTQTESQNQLEKKLYDNLNGVVEDLRLQRNLVLDKEKNLNELLRLIELKSNDFVSRFELEKKIISINAYINNERQSQLQENKNTKIEIQQQQNQQKKEISLQLDEIRCNVNDLTFKIENLENNLELYRQHVDTVLKEFRIEKKFQQVTEKHIQYILDKLKKGGLL